MNKGLMYKMRDEKEKNSRARIQIKNQKMIGILGGGLQVLNASYFLSTTANPLLC